MAEKSWDVEVMICMTIPFKLKTTVNPAELVKDGRLFNRTVGLLPDYLAANAHDMEAIEPWVDEVQLQCAKQTYCQNFEEGVACGCKYCRDHGGDRNTNCLEGLRCPACGSLGSFGIETRVFVEWTDDGTNEMVDPEFGPESAIICRECGKTGQSRDFRTKEG